MRFWRSPALLTSLLTVVSITTAAAGSDPALTVTAPPSAVVSASTLAALVFTDFALAASGTVILESTCAFKALAWALKSLPWPRRLVAIVKVTADSSMLLAVAIAVFSAPMSAPAGTKYDTMISQAFNTASGAIET